MRALVCPRRTRRGTRHGDAYRMQNEVKLTQARLKEGNEAFHEMTTLSIKKLNLKGEELEIMKTNMEVIRCKLIEIEKAKHKIEDELKTQLLVQNSNKTEITSLNLNVSDLTQEIEQLKKNWLKPIKICHEVEVNTRL